VLNFNLHRPRYVVVPPGVWHCLRNVSPARDAAYIVLNDTEYRYDAPDDWTLAKDAAEIPVSLD
jgi:dTDP-4-dehydrorhamnose 3,5-epimerase